MRNLLSILLTLSLIMNVSSVGSSRTAILGLNVNNDIPGPVMVQIDGWDIHGDLILHTTLSWADNDNSFSTQSIVMDKTVRVLRFTFINDFFVHPFGPNDDRNAYIDYFMVNYVMYEAENFDRTGGPDPQFPGCAVQIVGGSTVADCGNQGDFVEYDLHPGNPMGPNPNGPGHRNGP